MGQRKIHKTEKVLDNRSSNHKVQQKEPTYLSFDSLNGKHPWMKVVPEGFISYRVRELRKGEVLYFNYPLAKEMGLIAEDHPHKMNSVLEKKLIETFSLQILNEYDELTPKKWESHAIKKHKYMATRYLQLQHKNKKGKTSGDGRGIWNGTITHLGKTWDVSSRGTGVTRLSPGAVESNKPLQTGQEDVGYGCGQAELDELLGAAIQSEILHLQGVCTERVLCVIGLDENYGIGVRAGHNLLRPAHLFLYLKQNRYTDLKNACDYLIQRQNKNKVWNIDLKDSQRYFLMVENIAQSFANFTAQLDISYIFAWLDWDGDNVLVDGGIIDYGSVRQFGIRHDRYRYDDIDRFSTNLNEQWRKARHIIQVFVQMADYLTHRRKKPIAMFKDHFFVKYYLASFKKSRFHQQLYRLGFDKEQRNILIKYPNLLNEFDKEYSYFERAKIKGKFKKVPDGINHPALFNLSPLFYELPRFYMSHSLMKPSSFFKLILSKFARKHDSSLKENHIYHILKFQKIYKRFIRILSGDNEPQAVLESIRLRTEKINRMDRITGNALIHIVNELLEFSSHSKDPITLKSKQMNATQVLIDQIVYNYMGYPEIFHSKYYETSPRLVQHPYEYRKLLEIIHEHNEDI